MPTWNRGHLLPSCLSGLLAEIQRFPGAEIILADNRSCDATLAFCADCSEILYLPVSEVGVNHARNRAAYAAKGGIFVFLDSDCLPQPGWLDSLTRPLREEGAGIACGAALAVCTEQDCRVPDEDLIPKPIREDIFENNFAVRAGLFRRVGGFNVELGPLGSRWRTHEGRDLLQRIRRVQPGARWVGVPEAVVHHFIKTRGGHSSLGGRRAWWGGIQIGQQSGAPNLLKPAAQALWNAIATLPFLLGTFLRRSPSNLARFRNKVHRFGESYGTLWAAVHRGAPREVGTTIERMSELCAGGGRPKSLLDYREVWPEVRVPMRAAELQVPFQHPFFSQTAPYRIPSRGVAIFESARILANPVGVITREGCLLGEVSVDWGRAAADHAWFREKRRDPEISLPGTSALLATTGGESFYHWIIECLPRIALLEGVRPDRWIVNDTEKPFIRESLALAGVPAGRIYSLSGKELLKCERLVVPSLPGPTGFPHPSAVAWLGGLFAENASSQKTRIRICLVRTKNARRRWVPSPWLQKKMASAGYIFVSLESLKLQQQADLFRCASDIVAPHGAALAFLALCPEKTNVLELVPAGYPNPCFYRLSRIRRLQHTVLFSGSKDRPPVWDLNPNNSDWPSESQIIDFL